jgi:hypothetical protein
MSDNPDSALKQLEQEMRLTHNQTLALQTTVEKGFETVGLRLQEISSSIENEFAQVNTKLDAIMSLETIATRKHLQAMIRALRAKGIELDEREILAA